MSSVPLSRNLQTRLSVMWFLEWGITGAILTYLPLYFKGKGLTGVELGQLMAMGAVGLWAAPFVVGQICDRWVATEKYLAVAHLLGGLALVAIPRFTTHYELTRHGFIPLLMVVGIYAVCYFPTIPLASSLTFRHLTDPDTQFGKIRLWGTVGWVTAGICLSLWLKRDDVYSWLVYWLPVTQQMLDLFVAQLGWLPDPESAHSFHIGAGLSFCLSFYAWVWVPHTPPEKSSEGDIAPLETFKMFRDRVFTLLIIISFLLSMVITLYSMQVPQLLEQSGFEGDWVPAVMTVGQISEFPALLLLPFFFRRVGVKGTFAIGIAAWLIRYLIFALEPSPVILLAAVALHGVCHVFLVIVIQLYIDGQSRPDLKNSAQNLFAFVTMGIALPLGFLLGGQLAKYCMIDPATNRIDYQTFFLIPAGLLLVLLFAFWKLVHFPKELEAASRSRKHRHPLPQDIPPPIDEMG